MAGSVGKPLSRFTGLSAALPFSTMISTAYLAAGLFGLGAPELIVILVILLVLFGGAKLPGLAKGLGQSIKEFKKSAKDEPEPEKPVAPEPKKVEKVEPVEKK